MMPINFPTNATSPASNDNNKPAHQCHVIASRRQRQPCPSMSHHCHVTPSNPMSLVSDDPNDTISSSQMTHKIVEWGDWSSCKKRRISREDGQGNNEVVCIPHTILYSFLHWQSGVQGAHCPIFFGFPPRGSPFLWHRWDGMHSTCRLFFFVNRVVCTLHTALFLFIFFPLEAALLLEDQQGSVYPTCCLIWFTFFLPQNFMYNESVWIPHATLSLLIFPPLKVWDNMHPTRYLNLFFFFSLRGSSPAVIVMTKWHESYSFSTLRQYGSHMPPYFTLFFYQWGGVHFAHCHILFPYYFHSCM